MDPFEFVFTEMTNEEIEITLNIMYDLNDQIQISNSFMLYKLYNYISFSQYNNIDNIYNDIQDDIDNIKNTYINENDLLEKARLLSDIFFMERNFYNNHLTRNINISFDSFIDTDKDIFNENINIIDSNIAQFMELYEIFFEIET